MNEHCTDCKYGLICVVGDDAHFAGTASFCSIHDIVHIYDAGDMDGIAGLGIMWDTPQLFAKLHNVSCNCIAADKCPRIGRLAGSGTDIMQRTEYERNSR